MTLVFPHPDGPIRTSVQCGNTHKSGIGVSSDRIGENSTNRIRPDNRQSQPKSAVIRTRTHDSAKWFQVIYIGAADKERQRFAVTMTSTKIRRNFSNASVDELS